jgi:hypothetical protein
MDASFFREKAQHCRSMAKIAIHPDLRAELLKFAEEFDDKAAKLDVAMAADKPGFVKAASDR